MGLDRISTSLSGKTLGTCTLQRLIGRGGMGMVYLAQQSRPRRTVAVKVLTPELFPNPISFNEFLMRFRREADAIAALEHVNIMPVYEYGEEDEFAYLVMPYVTGGSLRDTIAKRGILPLNEVVQIAEQVAAALDYAHQHGIIHRDLKPGNILFHADGRVLLTDFGIAKVVGEPGSTNTPQTITTTGMIIGTPEFLSPEQAKGGPIDHRSDIYSFGVVLFQLLAGRAPFIGTSAVAIAIQHAMESPPSLTSLNPSVPQSVEQVIMRALSKLPEDRYSSAGEMAKALREAASSTDAFIARTVPATPAVLPNEQTLADVAPPVRERRRDEIPRPPQQPAKQQSGKRMPILAAALSGLLVVLVITGSLIYLRSLPNRNQGSGGPVASPTRASQPTSGLSPTAATSPTLSPPSIEAGKLLYGTINPACDNLWTANREIHKICSSTETRLTNTSNNQINGVLLKSLQNGASIPNDYILEVKVKLVRERQGTFGIVFRTQDGGNHKGGFLIAIDPSGYWRGYTIDDNSGKPRQIVGLQGNPALSTTNFTTIAIRISGNSFWLYFNGNQQGTMSSPNYPGGNLGLALYNGAAVTFSNLAIYTLK